MLLKGTLESNRYCSNHFHGFESFLCGSTGHNIGTSVRTNFASYVLERQARTTRRQGWQRLYQSAKPLTTRPRATRQPRWLQSNKGWKTDRSHDGWTADAATGTRLGTRGCRRHCQDARLSKPKSRIIASLPPSNTRAIIANRQKGTIKTYRVLLLRELPGPLPCSLLVARAVRLVGLRDFWDERIVGVWIRQQGANRKKHFRHGQRRAPLIAKNV
jgi:hypothetical protein